MKLNKKGMTLIEILVVLVISSLIMVIAGSLILNGLGYFDKTASSDIDKQVTDSISSFVRDELIYASDVRISTSQPSEASDETWHYFALSKEGYLIRDGEVIYPKDYYNHKILNLEAYIYKNKYRMDLKFSLMDGKKVMYQTSTTLELINIKQSIIKNANDVNEKANYDLVDISHASANKIYYQKGKLGITDDPDIPPANQQDGTVADEEKCKNSLNTREWKDNGKTIKFYKGTFVNYNGVLYRAVRNVTKMSSPENNENGDWKVIARSFQNKSSYERGDVVEYPAGSDSYFICTVPYRFNNIDYSPDSTHGAGYWTKIPKDQIDVNKYDYCETKDTSAEGTVGDEIKCITDNNLMIWEDWNDTHVSIIYPQGTYIEYPIGSNTYYKSVRRQGADNSHTPNNKGWGWKKIEKNWNVESMYEYGDIVYDETDKGRGSGYYKFMISAYEGNSETSPSDSSNFAWWSPITEDEVKKNDACRITYN